MVQNKNNIEFRIILVLIKNKTHLREIARTLNESHSTILRKINQLVKENILDYKREGKNKVFFIKNNLNAKNHVYLSEIYKLSKLLKKYPELSAIFNKIQKNKKIKLAILFGSYAKFIAKPNSDIDIYIETKNQNLKKEIQMANTKLSIKIGQFTLSSLLIKEIIKNHVIIKGVENFYEKTKFFE